MAQQGGTFQRKSPLSYSITAGNKTFGSASTGKQATKPEASKPAHSDETKDDKELSEDWDLVEYPIVDKDKDGQKVSSQFTLDVGWGSWRTTVFAWDVNVRIDI